MVLAVKKSSVMGFHRRPTMRGETAIANAAIINGIKSVYMFKDDKEATEPRTHL
jgi:hypothetical protein